MERNGHNIGYIFKFFKEANSNGDTVVVTSLPKDSVSIRIEFDGKGLFKFADDCVIDQSD